METDGSKETDIGFLFLYNSRARKIAHCLWRIRKDKDNRGLEGRFPRQIMG